MLLQPKVILRTDTEPSMLNLRKKVRQVRKLNNLDTELQDAFQTSTKDSKLRGMSKRRNLAKTLIYGAEKESKVKITSESTLYPWIARRAAFLLC